jgi:hypothetical protein
MYPAPPAAQAALEEYFRATRNEPQGLTVLGNGAEFTWTQGLRTFRATFAYVSGAPRLEVWTRVTPKTPGAQLINGEHYLPANTNKQINDARRAEAAAPR